MTAKLQERCGLCYDQHHIEAVYSPLHPWWGGDLQEEQEVRPRPITSRAVAHAEEERHHGHPRKLPSRLHRPRLHHQRYGEDTRVLRGGDRPAAGHHLGESDELFGQVRTLYHCFFGLADGGALAFFQFADKSDEQTFSPPIPETPFHHIALKVDTRTQGDRAAPPGSGLYGARHFCAGARLLPFGLYQRPQRDAPRIHTRCAQRRAGAQERQADARDPPAVAQGRPRRTTCIGRALVGRFVEAPVKGTPMIMTEDYRRILARAAHGQLPPWVVEESEPDFRCIRDLYGENGKWTHGRHPPPWRGLRPPPTSARKAGDVPPVTGGIPQPLAAP